MSETVKHVGLAESTATFSSWASTAISIIIVSAAVFGFFMFASTLMKARNPESQGMSLIIALLVSAMLGSIAHVFGFSISWFE